MKPPTTYIINGRKKLPVVVMQLDEETINNTQTFVMPTYRHVATGKPDGHIVDGVVMKIYAKTIMAKDDYIKNPSLVGLTLSHAKKRYTILSTTVCEVQSKYMQVSIDAVRYVEKFKIVHYTE